MSATAELQRTLSVVPPNFVGNQHNPAAVAHGALQALRDAGDPQYLFLRTIAENGSSISPELEELLFHCITGTRHVILSKWAQLAPIFRAGIRDIFLVLGQAPSVSRTIRLAYYNASASFWKRHWNDPNFDAQQSSTTAPSNNNNPSQHLTPDEQTILQQLSSLSTSAPPQLSTFQDLFQYLDSFLPSQPNGSSPTSLSVSASFLSTLVGEFAGKSASPYRLPLEFHKRAHEAFEKQGWLESSLKWSMTALSHVVNVATQSTMEEVVSCTVVQVTLDVLSWEFGTTAFDAGNVTSESIGNAKSLLRPPASWRPIVLQPDFLKACFHLHSAVTQQGGRQQEKLAQGLRQLLLLLGSLSGPIFSSAEERHGYCSLVLEGTLGLMASVSQEAESTAWMDTLSLISRLIANFQLSTLAAAGPNLLHSLVQGMAAMGRKLLQDQRLDCESVQGDLESMAHREWREEALQVLLEGCVLLCGDSWLWYAPDSEAASRQTARSTLASTFGSLYSDFVQARTSMARLEEHYLTQHEEELDEVREDIFAVDLDEEMKSLADVGRLDMLSSLACLSTYFSMMLPQLQALWEGTNTTVTPEAAGLLEVARLITMYIGHLLTDDNSGETPVIPDSIIMACATNPTITQHVSQSVQILIQFAEMQASKIAVNPSDPRLSPLLGKTFLWFLQRWAPAYIMPIGSGDSVSTQSQNTLLQVWATRDSVQQAVSFSVTLCAHYHCYWPHEGQVQDGSSRLILSIAKRCKPMRLAMIASPSFMQLLSLHCLTAGIRHSAPPQEMEATVRAKAGNSFPPVAMIRGYQRLPYSTKSRILTALLVATSDYDDEHSKALLNDCLKAIHETFSSLVDALSNKKIDPNSVDAKEMASLCAELYGGVARAGDMEASDRIPKFLTPSLPHLSGLMAYYAHDLSICESLLRLFCDYAEQFIAVLESAACTALFRSSADLLKSYSAHHCQRSRVVAVVPEHPAEEEQAYSDILCVIQLLIQLGSKDFIDAGNGNDSGVDSSQVTDMIFFGLQQILPLMTQGLLQFPTLCSQYFSLVGFVMETYTDKLKILPYELFDALLESLLFGMSHHDNLVAKASLHGLTGMIREHLSSRSLDVHLSAHPEILDKCISRLLLEVVFSPTVWDRLEPAGMLLLPLAAVDLQRFGSAVQTLALQQQVPPEQQHRLTDAFQRLLQEDMIQRVTSRGYEGRQNRIRFKKQFEDFCHEIHSFLVIK